MPAPGLNQLTKGAAGFTQSCFDQVNSLWEITGSGAPTNGASGTGNGFAAKGSRYTDYANGKLYINTGTKASPTWTVVGAQTA